MARPIARTLLAVVIAAAAGVAGAGAATAAPAGPEDVKLVSMSEVAKQVDTQELQEALASWDRGKGGDGRDRDTTGGDDRGGHDGDRNWFEKLFRGLLSDGENDPDVLDVDLLSQILRDVDVDADVRDNILLKLNDVLNRADILNGADVDIIEDVATFDDVLNGNTIIKDVLNGNNVNLQDVIAIGTSKGDTVLVTK